MKVPGVSQAQLHYWARNGHLRLPDPAPGSGYSRQWPPEELRVAEVMGRLRAAGLPLGVAESVARGRSEIAPGVRVIVEAGDEAEADREAAERWRQVRDE